MNAICNLAQVPVRLEPSDKSEMVTQILFGETFSILEERGNWLLISIHLDNYEGWIDRKQAQITGDVFIGHYNHFPKHVVTDRIAICSAINDGTKMMLGKGCRLPDFVSGNFHLGEKVYFTQAKIKAIPRKFNAAKVASMALDYLNTPYLWGGRSIMGIDCSGLVQIVYHICGLDLPRDAAQQTPFGKVIDFIDEAMPGDLAFFDNPSGEIIHVGIIIGPGKIIHASGRVKIDKIDHNGIYNLDNGKYSHSLRIIKRM